MQQEDTVNGGGETNAVLFHLNADDLEETEEKDEDTGILDVKDQWLLNNINEVHYIIHYFNDTDYLEEPLNDSVTIMLASTEVDTVGGETPVVDSVVRKSDSVNFHATFQVTEEDLGLTLASLSEARNSTDHVQYLLVLGYYKVGTAGNFYLLRVNAFDAFIMRSHVVEGFEIGLYNGDIQPRMYNHYDPLDKNGHIFFAGSWIVFGFGPYRYAVFKISTSEDILLEEIKETRKELAAI